MMTDKEDVEQFSLKSQYTGSPLSGEMVLLQGDSLEIVYPPRPPRVPVPNHVSVTQWEAVKTSLLCRESKDDSSVSSKENDELPGKMDPPKKVAATATTAKWDEDLASKKRWPQYSNLIREYPALVLSLLSSVDDCDAQNEQNAKNTENIKGNKWAHLQFVCFVGNRGSLSGRLSPVEKATILKKKVMDIWK
jgi:hypothetical protein